MVDMAGNNTRADIGSIKASRLISTTRTSEEGRNNTRAEMDSIKASRLISSVRTKEEGSNAVEMR